MKKQILTIAVAVTCLSGFVSSVQASQHKGGGHHSSSGNHTASSHSGRGGHSSKGGHNGGISGDTVSEAITLFRDLIDR